MKNFKLLLRSALAVLALAAASSAQAIPVQILYNGSTPPSPLCLPANASWASFSLINTAGKSNFTWSVRGDLAIAGNPNGSASGIVCSTIGSFNKNPSFNTQPFSPIALNGLGKGRITVSYLDSSIGTQCGLQSVSLDVYKLFCPVGWPIVGPLCASPGDTVTYSIHSSVSVNLFDNIGIDRYFWSYPSSMSVLYYSGDSSSITLLVGGSYTGGTIGVKVGQCNGCTETLVLGLNAPAPSISPAGPICLAVGATSQVFTASAPAPGVTYTWSVAGNNTWTIAASGTGNVTGTLSLPAGDPNPGYVILTSTGACDVRRDTIRVNRPLAGTISAPNGTCITIGSTYTFSVNTAQAVNWTMPSGSGWTVTPNATSPIITLTATAAATSGTLSVVSACGSALTLPLNIRPGNAGPITSTATCLPPGSTTPIVLNIAGVTPAATSYQWTIAPGSAGSITTGATTAVFTPSGTNTAPVTITVTPIGASGCNGAPSSIVLNYSPTPPVFTTVPSCINYNFPQTLTYGVTPVAGNTYTWSVSPAGVVSGFIPNGATTTFNINATTSNFTVTCTATNTCGTANTPITATVGTTSFISTSFTPGPGNLDVYILNNPPPSPSYQWYVNGLPVSNSATVSGATSQALLLSGNGTPPTSVCVRVTSGGCITNLCASPVGTHSARMAPGFSPGLDDKVTVFPNPNQGTFKVSVPAFRESARVVLTDPTGKEIMTRTLASGETTISEAGLAAGNYVLLFHIDGKIVVKRIAITR